MVSTRQMSNVNGSCEAGPSGSTRTTRNSALAVCVSPSRSSTSFDRNLLELPQEVWEKIFGYLTFKNICQLRLVCCKFDSYCGQLLNVTFQRLQTQMLHRFQEIKGKMPRRESARRNHHLACESDIIETLHMRLTLLQMTFGKHIERKHCCFFPGEILDEVYNILTYIRNTPKLNRPYKVTDELFDLSTMAMEYFKEKIEPDLPEIAYFGADFLTDYSASCFPATTNNYLAIEMDSSPLGPEEGKETGRSSQADLDQEEAPQRNMVSGIRKIRQGMKRYNNLLSSLKRDLRNCKRKTSDQQKQIKEQQKLITEQSKTALECTTRMDEYDKKNDEISRKFSTLLQELNKCKTELQYWRSKSPATPPFCNACGSNAVPPSDDLLNANQCDELPPDFDQVEMANAIFNTPNVAALEQNEENWGDDVVTSQVANQLEEDQQVCSEKKTDEAVQPMVVGGVQKGGKRKLEGETPASGKNSGRRGKMRKRVKL